MARFARHSPKRQEGGKRGREGMPVGFLWSKQGLRSILGCLGLPFSEATVSVVRLYAF